jgi:hypothetical protein
MDFYYRSPANRGPNTCYAIQYRGKPAIESVAYVECGSRRLNVSSSSFNKFGIRFNDCRRFYADIAFKADWPPFVQFHFLLARQYVEPRRRIPLVNTMEFFNASACA